MTILITGGAGYIGAQTAYAFSDAGKTDLCIADSLVTGFANSCPPDIPLRTGDLLDPAFLGSVFLDFKIDTVIHIAGATVVSESVKNPLKYYRNNAETTRLLLEFCIKYGVKNFIFSSTAAVYGNNPARLVNEAAQLMPESPYAWSKMMAEQMIRDASTAHNINAVILRYFNVSGADPQLRTGLKTPNATHLVKVLCEVATGKRPHFTVYGTDYDTRDGSCERDLIHVHDIATAHLSALDFLQSGKGGVHVFNCGYGRGYTVLETIRAIEAIAGHPIKVEHAPRRDGDVVALMADASALRAQTGWTPAYDHLETILRSALAWEERAA